MQPNPSLTARIFGALICFLVCAGLFFELYKESFKLTDGIYNHLDVLVFDKSAMYLLGGGIFFLNIFASFIYSFVTGVKNTKNTKKNNILIFIVPFIIAFVLPHIVHGYVKSYINENSYVYCQDQSVVKFRFTKYIYAKDLNTCKTYKK